MLNNMIEIRNKSCFAHRENADSVPETFIVAFQLALRNTKDRVMPVAEELHDKPQDQQAQQNPLPRRMQEMEENESDAVQAQSGKLRASESHSLDQ